MYNCLRKQVKPLTALSLTVAAVLILWLALAAGDTPTARAQTADTPTPVPINEQPDGSGGKDIPPVEGKTNPPKYPNMDSNLNRIVQQVETGIVSTNSFSGGATATAKQPVAATIYFTEGYADAISGFLNKNGASLRNIGIDYIEAYIPLSLLAEASQQEGVISVRTIMPATSAQNAVGGEGAVAHGAPAWHDAGVKGHGVKIGVIDVGFEGFRTLMGSELPDAENVHIRCYTDIGVLATDANDCIDSSGSKHGTAVTEAVFDIAPEAEYYIANPWSRGDLQNSVQWMIDNDVDVINQSLSWRWDGPGDGTSPFSDSPLSAVDTAVAGGIAWANSAGNWAQHSWFGPFEDTDSDSHHNYAGTNECNNVTLKAGDRVSLVLRWDDNWLGASRDLDLHLIPYDEEGNLLIEDAVSSELEQSGRRGDYPRELIYVPVISDDHMACINVRQFSGAPPAWMQLLSRAGQDLELHTLSGGINNPSESANPGLLAVGAAPWSNTQSIEPYSDQGPAPDGRTKPDIVGADYARSAIYRSERNPEGWFRGTSQASPHVAGLAALVKQLYPNYTPQQVTQYLKNNAEPRGAVPNNTWGYGFAKLPASDASSPTPSPPPEPTATPVPPGVTPEPTATAEPTATPEATIPSEIENRLTVLETLLVTLQNAIAALTSRVAALELGASQPTPTPIPTQTPTPTPVATATPLPPGVTPEPTATAEPTATPEPHPCRIDMPASFSLPVTLSGLWIQECVYSLSRERIEEITGIEVAAGDRYYRYTGFEVTAVGNGAWTATLESSEDTVLFLWEWDEENEELVFVAGNDDIVRDNTNSGVSWTPTEGKKFYLDMTTYDAETLGDFTLTIRSGSSNAQSMEVRGMQGDAMPSEPNRR